MLKLERNMIERIIEGKATIDFQVEAYKALGESLRKIETSIKEAQEIAGKIDIKAIEKAQEIKPVKTIKEETKKELNVKEVKQEIKQEAKKQLTKNNKMIKCGKNEGPDEVVYIEKIVNDNHAWRGQIRLQNVVYNFHWSNELSLPVVYNAPDLSYLLTANEMIKEKVGEKECNKYDELFTKSPDLGNYGGRYYYDEIEKGSFIYMTPWFKVETEEPKVWFKGYTMDHAFIVFSNKRIYYRNVNYIFAKRPWESSVSKGYDTKEVRRNVCKLMKLVIEQFDNCVENDKKEKEMEGSNTAITKTEPDLNNDVKDDKSNDNDVNNATENKVDNNDDTIYVKKGERFSIEDAYAGKRYYEDKEAQKEMLENIDVSALL